MVVPVEHTRCGLQGTGEVDGCFETEGVVDIHPQAVEDRNGVSGNALSCFAVEGDLAFTGREGPVVGEVACDAQVGEAVGEVDFSAFFKGDVTYLNVA